MLRKEGKDNRDATKSMSWISYSRVPSSSRIVTFFPPPSRKPPIPRADDVRGETCPTWKAPAAPKERAKVASVDFMIKAV